jgi:resuscitation-promoting factor RpfB
VSGTRSTRGAGGGGNPLPGSVGRPTSFAGPAEYSPTHSGIEGTPPEIGLYDDPYAPYADNPTAYYDPYAEPGPEAPYQDEYLSQGPAASYPDPATEQYPSYPDPYAEPYPEPSAGPAGPPEPGYGPSVPSSPARHRSAALVVDDPQVLAEPEPAVRSAPASIPRQRDAGRGHSGRGRAKLTGTSTTGKVVRGVVLLALVGAVTSYVAFEKTVNLSVDGQVQQLHSFASTVGAVLTADSITTGSHDFVNPAPSAALVNNATITVRYGRPVNVTINGTRQDVWVHSTTVGGALTELGVRTAGAAISIPASTPVSRTGLTFSIYTLRRVVFLVDGKTVPLETTAATISAALAQAGITLRNQDTASVPLGSVPTDGENVSVLRISGTTQVEQVAIPYPITKVNDSTTYVGSTSVVTSGQDGVTEVTYALQIINGVKQKPKEISSRVTKQPVAEVEDVGTKALPSSASGLDWSALAECESGGNPEAVDPSGTYFGLYQFSVATWDTLGGSGLPSEASSAEQTERAELLYERSGAGQWPVCGHNLFN